MCGKILSEITKAEHGKKKRPSLLKKRWNIDIWDLGQKKLKQIEKNILLGLFFRQLLTQIEAQLCHDIVATTVLY